MGYLLFYIDICMSEEHSPPTLHTKRSMDPGYHSFFRGFIRGVHELYVPFPARELALPKRDCSVFHIEFSALGLGVTQEISIAGCVDMSVQCDEEVLTVLKGGGVPECELSERVQKEQELGAGVVARFAPKVVARVEPVFAEYASYQAVVGAVAGFKTDLD